MAFVTNRPVVAERFTERAAAAFCLELTVMRFAIVSSLSALVEDDVRLDAFGHTLSVLNLGFRIQGL